MSSRILLRLIDESIIPALSVFLAKVIAVLYLIQTSAVGWRLDPQTVVPRLIIEDPIRLSFINTYSNLVMLFVALCGLVWVLLRAYHLHESHIEPKIVLRLLSLNLTALIVSSEDIYHQATVWLALVWLTTMLIGFQTLLNMGQSWLLFVSFMVAIFSTWFVVADVEREMEPSKL
ncbi:hypothetical protein HGA91_01250 [candidate division WWE3 bacterium]|nr:hypothetical protein [candidate division WWE3 bacterium]